MKQFIETRFFHTLQKISQKNVSIDTQVLQNEYDEFVRLLFSEFAVLTDKTTFHNSLVYTRVELAGLTEVLEKKCNCF